MTEGDVALAHLPQVDRRQKIRPVVLLRKMPPYGDWLVCGISTQLTQEVSGFDEIIEPSHQDFAASGLKTVSLIRLGYLLVLPTRLMPGRIGFISPGRLSRLQERLGKFIATNRYP